MYFGAKVYAIWAHGPLGTRNLCSCNNYHAGVLTLYFQALILTSPPPDPSLFAIVDHTRILHHYLKDPKLQLWYIPYYG